MKLEGLRINLAKTYVVMLRFTATSMKSYLEHVFLKLLIEIIIIKKSRIQIYIIYLQKNICCQCFELTV